MKLLCAALAAVALSGLACGTVAEEATGNLGPQQQQPPQDLGPVVTAPIALRPIQAPDAAPPGIAATQPPQPTSATQPPPATAATQPTRATQVPATTRATQAAPATLAPATTQITQTSSAPPATRAAQPTPPPPPATAATQAAPTTQPTQATQPTQPTQPAPSLHETRFELVRVAALDSPIALVARPGTGRRYAAGLGGQVWLLDPPERDAAAGAEPQLVADIGSWISRGCENGLLGIAFSPDGSHLYLSYTDTARNSRITAVPMDGKVPRIENRRVLLAVEQPACNHNGGHIAFGPDGHLWIGLGDGGGANDTFGHGQDASTLLGAILRIDPMSVTGRGYGIPDGNPFAGADGAAEIWAYGARNPWRFSFDRHSGDLWIGDVGQDRFEEIHVLTASDGWMPGANLGWPLLEGYEPFAPGGSPDASATVLPVYAYSHDEGCSVTGGYVYRGPAIEALWGVYVFGDYCTGRVWALVRGSDGRAQRLELGVSVPRNSLVSFAQDAEGELYVLSSHGAVLRLEAAPGA